MRLILFGRRGDTGGVSLASVVRGGWKWGSAARRRRNAGHERGSEVERFPVAPSISGTLFVENEGDLQIDVIFVDAVLVAGDLLIFDPG